MKLYVVSDLHNEFGQYFDPRLYARAIDPDVIVLPGDIDANTEGIKWARKAFGDNVPIVYVAGNHELYNGYWERTLDDLRQTAREFEIHFLENDPWKTKESVELATLEWVSWFNHHRLLEPIGYIPPAEAEANYYRQFASQAASVAA
jgi:predicted phosphodiesterase